MTRGELQFGGNTVKVWIDVNDGEIRASSVRPKESIRFRAFAEKYESEILRQMKPASQLSIKSNIRILNETFGDLRLVDIDTEKIQKFASSHPYSPVTVKNRLATMRMIWSKARAWKYVKDNPFEFLSMPRSPKTENSCLSVDDVRAIIARSPEPYKTMLMILAETGCRGGELVALRHSDIDGQTIRIARSAFRKTIQAPKTENAVRKICISGQLARKLEDYATSRRYSECLIGIASNQQQPCPNDRTASANSGSNRETPVGGWPEIDFLFPYKDGCWDNGEITRRLGIGLHQFRHFSKSLMQSLGVPEYIQDERMGHAKQGMSGRYTHSSPEDHKKWAEIIGQALSTENVLSRAMGAD